MVYVCRTVNIFFIPTLLTKPVQSRLARKPPLWHQIYMLIEPESLLFNFLVAASRPAFLARAASHTHLLEDTTAACAALICDSGQETEIFTGCIADGGGCGICGSGSRISVPGTFLDCSTSRMVRNAAEGDRSRFGGWNDLMGAVALKVDW
jgi:hypothetical protein